LRAKHNVLRGPSGKGTISPLTTRATGNKKKYRKTEAGVAGGMKTGSK